MSLNQFWNLLAKKLSGEALPEEIRELDRLIKENPDWVYAAERVEALMKLPPKEVPGIDAELAFEAHLERCKTAGLDMPGISDPPAVEEKKRRRRLPLLWGSAGLSVLAAVLFFWNPLTLTKSSQSPAARPSFSEVSTRPGSKSRMVLPDSSIVWLNAGSRLSYQDHFGITNRNVQLTGEAFFDVKKGGIPFIIRANGVRIRVMGTAFNVKSYPNEHTTETSLIRGRVEITLDRRPDQVFVLRPDEKLIVSNEPADTVHMPAHKNEPIVVLSPLSRNADRQVVETSWVENKLVFQDESFEEIARKMERWYDVSIEIRGDRIRNLRLTGSFDKESVEQALSALQIAFPFHYKTDQNKITITE